MEAREPELYAWFDALKEREQAYCAAAWNAMSDPMNHGEPLPHEFALTYLRSLEVQGVLARFHEQAAREERAKSEMKVLNDPEDISGF